MSYAEEFNKKMQEMKSEFENIDFNKEDKEMETVDFEEPVEVERKGGIKGFIKENPEVAVIGTAIITAAVCSAIGKKLGYKKGHKVGFAAGVEACKFVGKLDVQCICPEKDVVKMFIKGMSGVGEKTLELSSNAEQATSLLKDLQACVAAAKTGADPDAIYDILNMSPETLAAIKSIGEI